jgi:hypothetical protein
MSEYLDTGHDAAVLEHEQQGNEYEHDAALHELHQAQAAEHDVQYQHGRHVEFDSPSGAHYSETEFTNYSEHSAEASSYDEIDVSEHEASASYAERLFAELEHHHLRAFETDHELPGAGHYELGHEGSHDAGREGLATASG